jgi:hypothetical protein
LEKYEKSIAGCRKRKNSGPKIIIKFALFNEKETLEQEKEECDSRNG